MNIETELSAKAEIVLKDFFDVYGEKNKEPAVAFRELYAEFLPRLLADKNSIWDIYAKVYLNVLNSLQPYRKLQEHIRQEAELKDGQSVVDIGCGPCGVWQDIDLSLSITGIDGSAAMLAEAHKHILNLKTYQHDFNQPLSFIESNSADRVTCLNALSFVQDAQGADQLVGEMARILRPNGRLVISISRQGYSSNLVLMRDYEYQTGETQDPARWHGTDLDHYARLYELSFGKKDPVVLLTANLWFVFSYPEGRLPSLRSVWPYFLLMTSLIMAVLVFQDGAFFSQITITPQGYAKLDTGPYTPFMSLFVLLHYLTAIIVLWYKHRQAKQNPILRNQINILLWSYIISIILGGLTNWFLPVYFQIPYFSALGPVASFVSLAGFAYAATHYRFLDLKFSLLRGLTYLTTLLILVTYFFLIFLNTASLEPTRILLINTVSALIILTAFLPLKQTLEKVFNLIIFGDTKNRYEYFREKIGLIMNSNLSISEAAKQILGTLQESFGLQYCKFVPAAQLAGVVNNNQWVQADKALYLDELVYRGEMEHDQSAAQMAQNMRSEEITVLSPIMQGSTLIGAITTGLKQDQTVFTGDELQNIEWLAKEAKIILANLGVAEELDIARKKECHETTTSVVSLNLAEEQQIKHQLAYTLAEVDQLGVLLHQAKPRNQLSLLRKRVFAISRTLEHISTINELRSRGLALEGISCDLAAALERAIKQLPYALEQRDFSGQTPKIKAKNCPASVQAYEFLVIAILTELLCNATQYGKKTIRVEVVADTTTIILRVKSVGTLTAKEIEKSLQPLSRHNGLGGSGLGLNFVQAAMQAFGGDFSFYSTGRDTVAECLFLPVKQDEN